MAPQIPAQGAIWNKDHLKDVGIPVSRQSCVLVVRDTSGSATPVGSLSVPSAHRDCTRVDLFTIQEKEHSSGIALQIRVSFFDAAGGRQKVYMHWFATAINTVKEPSEVNDSIQLRALATRRETNTPLLTDRLAAAIGVTRDDLGYAVIQRPHTLVASNLFTTKEDFGSQSAVVSSVRRHLALGDSLWIIVRRSDRMVREISAIKTQMKQQLQEGFHRRWFTPQNATFEAYRTRAPLGISANALLTPGTEPQAPVGYRKLAGPCFATPAEFLMTAVLGLEKEHELDMKKPNVKSGLDAYFFKIPSDKKHMNFVLVFPRTERDEGNKDALTIKKKDIFHLEVGDKSHGATGYRCSVRRVNPLLNGRKLVVGGLECKSSFGENFYGPVSAPMDSQKLEKIEEDLKKILLPTGSSSVTITTKVSETTHHYLSLGLERCQNMMTENEESSTAMKDILLGNRLDVLPKVDLFGNLEGTRAELDDYLDKIFRGALSEQIYLQEFSEQKEALTLFRSVPGGVCILDGCAGSGKSHVLCCIILALILRKADSGSYNKILITLAMNATCDATTQRLKRFLKSVLQILGISQEPIVLRGHKINSEQEFLNENAETRARERGEAPGLSGFRIDDSLVDAVQQSTGQTRRRKYRISNQAVVDREKSVGWMMAKYLGLIEPGGKHEKSRYRELRKRLVSFHLNRAFSRQEILRLRNDLLQLHKHVVGDAAVVVLTYTQALDATYRTGFDSTVLVSDEASQINNVQFAAVRASYPHVRRIVLAGDCNQHGVYYEDRDGNPVLDQWKQSIHQRFHDLGYATAHFHVQRRCTLDIANLVSELFYHSRVVGRPETRDRELSRAVRAYNERSFSSNSNVVFINVAGAECLSVGNGKHCPQTADASLALVKSLVNQGFKPQQCLLLAPYTLQKQNHENRLRALAKQDPRYKGKNEDTYAVEIHTFKSVQGRENVISIMDLTVGRNIGFMDEPSQTLVGCSRGSDALYIVGDIAQLRKMRGYSNQTLGGLVRYCVEKGYERMWSEARL